MAISSSAVTVTTSATVISTGPADGHEALVVNTSPSTSIYIGGSDVSTSNGVELAPDASLSVDLANNEIVYGIVASGTVECRVLTSTFGYRR